MAQATIISPALLSASMKRFRHGVFPTALDPELMACPWYCVGMTREDALRYIGDYEGAFVIRKSNSLDNFLVLSYRCGDRLFHEPIAPPSRTNGFYHLSHAPSARFTSLVDFVAYYTQPNTTLNCPLQTHRPYSVFQAEQTPWFHPNLSENEVVQLLSDQVDGAFLIRNSRREPNSLVLCYVAGRSIVREYIDLTAQGYSLRSNPTFSFQTLTDLVAYFGQPGIVGVRCPLVVVFFSAEDVPYAAQQTGTMLREAQDVTLTRDRQHSIAPSYLKYMPRQLFDGQQNMSRMMSLRQASYAGDTGGEICLHCGTLQTQTGEGQSQSQIRSQSRSRSQTQEEAQSTFNASSSFSARRRQSRHSRHHLKETSVVDEVLEKYGVKYEGGRCWKLNMDAQTAQKLLEEKGSFVVHRGLSDTYPFAISMHNPSTDRIRTAPIEQFETDEGDVKFALKDCQPEFYTLAELVEHYCHPAQCDLPFTLGDASQ
eukprot:m.285991 g.285991  ORF g.285991 m.285991 type:complete len:483 (+) comp15778_c0_seq26:1877-3325(+)